jgi:hypothetical protein
MHTTVHANHPTGDWITSPAAASINQQLQLVSQVLITNKVQWQTKKEQVEHLLIVLTLLPSIKPPE